MFKANHIFHTGDLVLIPIPIPVLHGNENRCFSVIILKRKNLDSKSVDGFPVTGHKGPLLFPTAALKGRF